MKIVFFKRPKAKPFEYKPLYYDKEKDEREQRRKELGLADDEAGKRAMFRGELQRRWRGDDYKKEKASQKKRVMIYLVLIGFVSYYIFFTDFLQKLVAILTTN
jgi:hypothetical protein